MARLTTAARKALPASDFAGPGHSFPIPDKKHAAVAEAYKRYASPATKARIDAKAAKFGVGPKAHKRTDSHPGMKYR